MSGFIAWLAPRYAEVRAGLRRERDATRQELLGGPDGHFGHSHAPTATAGLLLGIHYLARFALEAGALNADECQRFRERGRKAILEAAELQAEHIRAADPAAVFVRLLASALSSGRAHLASTDGREPSEAPAALGWKYSEFANGDRLNSSWSAQGKKVGWVDGELCLLLPDAAYAEVQRLAGEHREVLTVGALTLWRRLHERNLLALVENRGGKVHLKVRRKLEGELQHVIVLRRDTVFPPSAPAAPSCRLSWGKGMAQRHMGGEEFTVTVRARPSDVPPHVRLRRWLKCGLRSFELEVQDYRETTPRRLAPRQGARVHVPAH
jgi:hypothetical protein